MRRIILLLFLCVGFVLPARAHVGSKDVFEQVQAGPYKLYVTVRPPDVIPGVAVVEVRISGDAVPHTLRVTPVPMTGDASKHPPTPDTLKVSGADTKFFTGSVWLMAPGSWKVSLLAEGHAGSGSASVPVPAVALQMLRMNRSIGIVLGILGFLLVVGVAAIVAAAARESRLVPGQEPSANNNRRAWLAGSATLAIALIAVWLGAKWWNVEAADYAEGVYHPLSLTPTLQGDNLDLAIGADAANDPHWRRRNTDLVPDHGHLMHLYAIREPGMDAVFHLHPAPAGNGELKMALPAMPAGRYRLFADIVHRSGLPETLTSTLDIPADLHGGALAMEDASATPAPVSAGELGPQFHLPDNYTMVWDKPASLKSGEAATFRFHLVDASGKPAADVVPYLGMAGHAAFVRDDFSTFAHTHPEGSAPMQSMEIANGGSDMAMQNMDSMASMPGMHMPETHIVPTVEFPYGFPKPGRYRIFVQMKHGSTVETGVFDADVQ